MNDSSQAYRARFVFPGVGQPIPGGIVTLAGGRIVSVGKRSAGPRARDLGDVAILPGLINAHTHLEFSHLRKPLGTPNMAFPDWIRAVIAHRAAEASARRDSLQAGLSECLQSGTAAIGEIATTGWSLDAFTASPIHSTLFFELIGLSDEAASERVTLAREHLSLLAASSKIHAGLSPHAPYTVHPELCKQLVELAMRERCPLTMHLAESPEELELLATASGPFRALLEERGVWQSDALPGGLRPLDYLKWLSRAPRTLVVHGNYLDDDEIAFIAEHDERMSVVYCPRTHAYFGHFEYPLARLLRAGVRVALGTDSRASNPDLSLLAEMRHVARHHTNVSPRDVLRMGTQCGAEALALSESLGSLEPGKNAALTLVRLPSNGHSEPHELLFGGDDPVVATMIDGQLFMHERPDA